MPPYLPTATAVTAAGTGVEPSGFGLSVAAATVGATRFGIGLRTDARASRLQGAAVLGATTWRSPCSVHGGSTRPPRASRF